MYIHMIELVKTLFTYVCPIWQIIIIHPFNMFALCALDKICIK